MATPPKAGASAAASPPASSTTAVPDAPSARPVFDKTKIKVVKILTLPLLKLRAGVTIYIKVLDKMYQAKPQKNVKDEDADKKPPMLMSVLNLETGEIAQIIPGSVLADIFHDEYPNATYIGKGFEIAVGEQKAVQGCGGKRYNQYTVTEIELPS